jgi:hypothetical protein
MFSHHLSLLFRLLHIQFFFLEAASTQKLMPSQLCACVFSILYPSPQLRGPGITLLIKPINSSFVSEIDGKFYNAILAASPIERRAPFAQDKQARADTPAINKSTALCVCVFCVHSRAVLYNVSFFTQSL